MMPKATVRTIYDWLNTVAPFDTQEEDDNSGLLVGSMNMDVQSVLLALDVTPGVLEEAAALDAQLIIAHHPLMFAPVQVITDDVYEGSLVARLIRDRRSLIAAHTNADQSEYSGTRAVAELLGLTNLQREGPYVWAGDLPEPETVHALVQHAQCVLGGTPVAHGAGERVVRTLAIAGGSYSQGYAEAARLGAQALLTGEVRHHHALYANAAGVTLIAAGHAETEMPMLPRLARGLQTHLNNVQCKAAVHVSSVHPYG